MRRPPIACQRAVQSLQSPAPLHIWVPDDILSSAVNRFFRSTCPHQKRHGSNVPGPLEARKRATKRRMTVSSGFYPQDNLPAIFNLGAWLGYGSKSPTPWRYEPPSLPRDVSLGETASHIPQHSLSDGPLCSTTDVRSSNEDASRPLAHDCSTSGQIGSMSDASTAISQGRYDSQEAEQVITDANEFDKCLERFKACLVARQKSSGEVKEAFTQHIPSAPFIWRYYAATLEHVRELGRDPRPILACLHRDDARFLRIANPFQSTDGCAEFVTEVDKAARKHSVRKIVDAMVQMAVGAGQSTTKAHDLILLRLIKLVGNQAQATKTSSQLSSAKTISNQLASNLQEHIDIAMLLPHLAEAQHTQRAIIRTVCSVVETPDATTSAEWALTHMPRRHLIELVPQITRELAKWSSNHQENAAASERKQCYLDAVKASDHWLQLLHRMDAQSSSKYSLLKAAIIRLAKSLPDKPEPAKVAHECFFKALLLYQNSDAQVSSQADELRSPQALFAGVLLQKKPDSTDYIALLDLAFPLIAKYAGLTTLLGCIRTMEDFKLPLSTQMDFDSLIKSELDEVRNLAGDVTQSGLQKRAVALQACEKLTYALHRMGHTLPARMKEVTTLSGIHHFSRVLLHAKTISALPIAYRDAGPDMSLMDRVSLAHQLAHHCAKDTTRTHRETWRSVFSIYRYLRLHALPMGPLLTKAIVHSSITRPLMENRFVSARRLIWACHLVAKVEGDEVAASVENRFFQWRGQLIARSKRVYVGVGGSKHSKAHVGTMKRLRLI